MSKDDERRERYAAALHEVESRCRHDASSFACHELADAAMALADAEREESECMIRDLEAEIREQDAEIHRLERLITDDSFAAYADAVHTVADVEIWEKDREISRLRAELDRANQRLAIADEIQRERACLTPGYTDGPCHCAHCDPAALERDNARLRAERDTETRIAWQNFYNYRDSMDTIDRARNWLAGACGGEGTDLNDLAEILGGANGETF